MLSNINYHNEFNIQILSNTTVNPLNEILEAFVRSFRMNPSVEFGNYDNIVQDSFSLEKANLVIIFYDLMNIIEHAHINLELLKEIEVREMIAKIKKEIQVIFNNLADQPLVLFNMFYPYKYNELHHFQSNLSFIARELNAFLAEQKTTNVELIDIEKIIATIGSKNAIEYKKFLKYKMLYSFQFFKSYVASIDNMLLRCMGKVKKVIVFDCDNTLWKGIVGEDGIKGIEMSSDSAKGIYFHLVQKMAVEWSKKGILICLCSKNNWDDVMQVIDTHEAMILTSEYIISMKVNWTNKAENLRHLASELNLGLDSFVFIDDSDYEVNLVKTQLPEVLTIQVPKEIETYPIMLHEVVTRFFNLKPISEDLDKLNQYKQQKVRQDALTDFGNIDDYLMSLGTTIKIYHNETEHIKRIAQLTQKTNQFNLTTRRYTEHEIEAYIKSDNTDLFSLEVKDNYGNSGITGVAIISITKTQAMYIDTFLLSCRVISRNVENAFLYFILDFYKSKGITSIQAEYIESKKNILVKDLYGNIGFDLDSEKQFSKRYSIQLENYNPRKEKTVQIIK
ncbi:MAG: HAD-IIIC family phosphatase [Saprospiraceae bacterium]